jgi:K+-transporting ATPase ATPase C chain
MASNIRACLWLLVLTVVLCSVIYPLALWGIGQAFFREKAEGSILYRDDKPVGSRLIGQAFNGDEYFQPRPSATADRPYNAAASGASNYAASNPLLRGRVAQALGPIVKYRSGPKKGQLVARDIEEWFQQPRPAPGLVAQWAKDYPSLAQNWVKADKLNSDYVAAWMKGHPAEVAQWLKDNPQTPEPKPEDLAVPFFTRYSTDYPGTFPGVGEEKAEDGAPRKVIQRKKEGTDIQSTFFDLWLQAHANADLEQVPADLVMASGSGLDPHITLANAQYQLDRVVDAWAEKTKMDKEILRGIITKILEEHKEAPFGGLVGVPLVNVLEVNLALDKRLRNRSAALLDGK